MSMTGSRFTLPGPDYHAPEVFALERERIFFRNWFYAGRVDGLVRAGRFPGRRRRRREHPGHPRQGRRAARLLQRLPPSRLTAVRRGVVRTAAQRDQVPVSRLELFTRRAADRHPVHGEGRDRPLRVRALAGHGRRVGGLRLRPSRRAQPGVSATACSPPGAGVGGRVRALRLRRAPHRAPDGQRGRRELEDPDRELQRVPALPDGAPGAGRVAPAFRTGDVFEEGRGDFGVTMAGGGSGYTKTGTTTLPLLPGIDGTTRPRCTASRCSRTCSST